MADDLPERGPKLERVVARAVERALADDFWKVRIARVVRWDAAAQRADCQPLVRRVYVGEQGARLVASRAVVPSCLVAVIGAGGFRSTFPISDGSDGSEPTTGLLLFCDDSLDRWSQGTGGEVDPELQHAHAPIDGIFIMGVRPFGAPWASYPTDHATIGADGGSQIHLRADKVVIGSESGAKPIGRNGDGATASDALKGWASVVETLLGAICTATGVANPLTAANSFSGATAGNPGKAGNLSALVASATEGETS